MSSSSLGQLRRVIEDADAVVIGAGSGLSAAAGHLYAGERFTSNFPDFIERYGLKDMYSSGFYPFETLEEKWAYWSRHIALNRYGELLNDVYPNLLKLVEGKDYFVVTSNVDHLFQKAGFEKNRLYYMQGDYGLWQCSVPCQQVTFDNAETVKQMVAQQVNCRIPSELVPYCPNCGAPMTMNLRIDNTFVQDAGWFAAEKRYKHFLAAHSSGRVVYLELGVGGMTPGIIKYPFWQQVYRNELATYACLNLGEAVAPKEIASRSILVDGDIAQTLRDLV